MPIDQRIGEGIEAREHVVERPPLVLEDEEHLVTAQAGGVEQGAQVRRCVLERSIPSLVFDDLER
jgi:hypothetical protein